MNRVFFSFILIAALSVILTAAGCGGSGEASLAAALEMVERGEYSEAIPLLEKISRDTADSSTAWCNLGVCYLEERRIDDAVEAFRKGVDLASGSPEAYEYLGRAYIAAGKLGEARDVLVTASAINPGNPRILTAIGVVEMKADNLKQAYTSTMEALEYDSAYAPALYNVAVLYRDKLNNRKLAERFFRRFISAAPSDPRAKEAQEYLNPQTSSVKESPAKALVDTAMRHIQEDHYDAALVSLNQAVQKDPGYSEAIWNKAVMIDQVIGDAEEAVGLYEDFRSKFPDDRRSRQASRRAEELKFEIAKAAAEQQEKESAETPADPVQALSAREALAAGVSWYRKGDFAKAEAFYKKTVELDETMAEGFYNLGLLYFKTKDFKSARSAFAKASALKADYVNARYMLAAAQYELGDTATATENLNAVLQEKPDFARAHYLLGRIFYRNNQLKASKIHFDRYALLTGRSAQ